MTSILGLASFNRSSSVQRMMPMKAASRYGLARLGSLKSSEPLIFPELILSWYSLWHVSQSVIRLEGELPPVFRLSRWWTFKIGSFFLPWQCWHSWLSRNKTYSRTFQNPFWSPFWYSVPEIPGFFNFCVSKEAVSTTVLVTGRIFWASSMQWRWVSILCSTEGASQPLGLLFLRLLNLGTRYLVLRFLLALRASLLVEISSVMSVLFWTSQARSSLSLVEALKPIGLEPASTPKVTGCVYLVESYKSLMVNGFSSLTQL